MKKAKWRIKNPNLKTVEMISRNVGLSPITAKILCNLGLENIQDIKKFLNPSLDIIHNPLKFKNIDKAVERIELALINQETICCYGDYDVDGITGSSLLFNFFKFIGAQAFPYVPNRIEEGYGLNKDALKTIKNMGASLMITADCGIRSIDEVEYGKEIGLEIIITDHHEPADSLPNAFAIVNPKLPDCEYPFKGISGSGVALKLAWAIADKLSKTNKIQKAFNEFLVDSLSFATLGTVADLVPLVDENRSIVKFGLESLRQAKNPGIQALLNVSIDQEKEITTEDVGFQIAPRINAAGRLGRSDLAIQLFTTNDKQKALELAQELNELNKNRQEMEKEYAKEAFEQAEEYSKNYQYTLVLNSQNWHSGIIGIIASRILDKYYRPTFVISSLNEENKSRGSARSIQGYNLPDALAETQNLLLQFGGHNMAAGFEILDENINNFRDAIEQHAVNCLEVENLTPTIMIDVEVPLKSLTLDLIQEIERLGPFGMGNPKPLFATKNVKVIGSPRIIGKNNNHLKFKVAHQGTVASVIAFNAANRLQELLDTESVDLVFYPNISEWNGVKNIDLQLKDFRNSV